MDQERPRKPIKKGVEVGRGRPPGYRWNVEILDAAFEEATAFLDADQYGHIAEQFRELARMPEPSKATTVDVRPVEDYFELRDKGGVLRKLNVRVFFHIHKPTRTIIVLSAIHKQNDGPTPAGDKARVRLRRRRYLESPPPTISTDFDQGEGS